MFGGYLDEVSCMVVKLAYYKDWLLKEPVFVGQIFRREILSVMDDDVVQKVVAKRMFPLGCLA